MPATSKAKQVKGKTGVVAIKSISRVLGSKPVLPGESGEAYSEGLKAAISELGADTPLQVYLVEHIYDCLWWIRRYEEQKRATLVQAMATQLSDTLKTLNFTPERLAIFDALNANRMTGYLKQCLSAARTDVDTLQQKAMKSNWAHIEKMDELIALKTKTMAGFQVSYEQLTSRKLQRERLEMQNALLKRDLISVDVEVVVDKSTPKPSK